MEQLHGRMRLDSHLRFTEATPRRRLPSLACAPEDSPDAFRCRLDDPLDAFRCRVDAPRLPFPRDEGGAVDLPRILTGPQSAADVSSATAVGGGGGNMSLSEVRLGRPSLRQSSSSSGSRRRDMASICVWLRAQALQSTGERPGSLDRRHVLSMHVTTRHDTTRHVTSRSQSVNNASETAGRDINGQRATDRSQRAS